MCIRQSGSAQTDVLLEPTTFDEIGQLLTVAAHLHTDGHGRFWVEIIQPTEMRHPEESTVSVPSGLYRIKHDSNWAGAALKGVCGEE
jgi:hypothetical protein